MRVKFVVTEKGIFFAPVPYDVEEYTTGFPREVYDIHGISSGWVVSGGVVDLKRKLIYSAPGGTLPYDPRKAVQLLPGSDWQIQDAYNTPIQKSPSLLKKLLPRSGWLTISEIASLINFFDETRDQPRS